VCRVVILFDLFNTLIPGGDDGIREAVGAEMAADLGVPPAAFARLTRDTWPERSTGALGDLPAMLRTLSLRLGVTPSGEGVERAAARRRAVTDRLLRADSGTADVLDTLRARGHRLGLVSNCTVEVPEAWAAVPLSKRMDATAFSCALGVAKPDPRIFLHACSALDARPGDCVYVGDGADGELPAASALGMRTIQTVQFAENNAAWLGERIGSLAELVPLLVPAARPARPAQRDGTEGGRGRAQRGYQA
jgi:putative hydrolase of the HAD superfamily